MERIGFRSCGTERKSHLWQDFIGSYFHGTDENPDMKVMRLHEVAIVSFDLSARSS